MGPIRGTKNQKNTKKKNKMAFLESACCRGSEKGHLPPLMRKIANYFATKQRKSGPLTEEPLFHRLPRDPTGSYSPSPNFPPALSGAVQGAGKICQGTIATGIISEGKTFAPCGNPEAWRYLQVGSGWITGTKIAQPINAEQFSITQQGC